MRAADWVVYSRDGCSLCEKFIGELAELLGPRAIDVRVVDIETDPVSKKKYFDRIPVLMVGGEFVCCYRLDRERVLRQL